MKRKITYTVAVLSIAMILGVTPVKAREAPMYALLNGATAGADIFAYEIDVNNANDENTTLEESFEGPEITNIENLANGSKISWSEYKNAAKYRVFMWAGEDWSIIGTVSEQQFVHTNLISGMAYRYTVRAMDDADNYIGEYRTYGSENVYLMPPLINVISNDYSGVKLTWKTCNGADNYIVLRKNKSDEWKVIAQTGETSYIDTSPDENMQCIYALRCSCAGGAFVSAYGDEADIFYLSAPEIKSFENTVSGTKITWNNIEYADNYLLYVNDGSEWRKIADVKETSFTHNNLESNKKYSYTVQCMSSSFNAVSGFKSVGWSNIFLSPPVLISAKNVNGGVEVCWQAKDGAQRYAVYRKPPNGKWKKLGDTKGISYIDKTAVSGTNYTYTVRCLSDDGKKTVSSYNSFTSTDYVAVPTIKSFENKSNGTLIKWTKSAGAAKYRIYIKTNGSWKKLADTTDLSYPHKGLTAGVKYTYTVRCMNNSGQFVSGSDKTGKSNIFILPPADLSLENVYRGGRIKWSASKRAQKYRVFRLTSGTSWVQLGDTENLTFTDKKAISGKTYKYSVRCISADSLHYTSSAGVQKSIKYLQAPSITSFANKADGIQINWSKVAGAAKYRVYAHSSTGWRIIGDSSGTSFMHNNLVNGESYTYTVRCLDKNNKLVSGFEKSGKTTIFFAPPKIAEISGAGNVNTVKWKAVNSVYGYRLYRRTVSKSWTKLADIAGETSYTDNSVNTGELYAYTLRCIDKNGKLISWFIDNTPYYRNGKAATGYVKLNGKYTYFKNGILQKNKIVGSSAEGYRYADSSGYCVTSYEIRSAVDFVVAHAKGTTAEQKLKSCFDYLYKHYSYERVIGIPSCGADMQSMAQRMFKNKRGNCFCYASAFACIAKVLGYRARAATGQVTSLYGGLTPHGWAEVYSGGQWLLCDPDLQKEAYGDYFMRTRAQFPVNPLVENKKFEVTFSNGNAVWK